jgi:glutathione S-transferase
MAPTLYISAGSPAVRAVQITVKAIGLELNLKELDFTKGEHLQPEYLKLNPQHTVPTLVDDDGFTLSDSHAIMIYLLSKYAKNDNLYPKDLKKKALVDQRLHFDSGVAYARVLPISGAIFRNVKTSLNDNDKESLSEVYSFSDTFLEEKEYMVGDSVTIADYSLFAIITTLNVFLTIDVQKYPRLAKWLKVIESRPEVEVSKKGLAIYETLMKSKLTS